MKIFSFLSLFALLGAASAQTCGSFAVSFSGYNCGGNGNGNGVQNALNNQARKVIYDAMADALEAEGIIDSADAVKGTGQYKTFFSDTVSVEGYDTADRRELALEQEQDHRDLQTIDCGNYGSVPPPYCSWCAWNCRRRKLLDEAIEAAAAKSGRSLEDVSADLCAYINNVLATENGIGCLKGATATCYYDAPDATRKEGIEVQSTAGADSGASILSMVIPAVPAIVGLMA